MLAALSPCCESHAFATLAPDTIVVEKKQDPAAARNNENVVFGKVTDVNGEPLTGVSVVVKGTTKGTHTDVNGDFKMPVGSKNVKLVVSYLGMKKQELQWKGRKLYVVLEDDSRQLGEVVVTGYGNIDARKNTSAVTSLKMDDILMPGMTSLTDALEGRVPDRYSLRTQAR